MPIMRLMPTSTTSDFVTAPSTLGNSGLLAIRLGIGATILHFGLRKFLNFDSRIEAMRSDGWRAPAFGALGLLFTGAGAYSVDKWVWHRERWPALVVASALVIAVVVGILTWVMLNGSNPIHLTAPTHNG